jgi:hypothetical protein
LAYQGDARFAMVDVPVPATLQFDHDADGQRRMTLEMGGQNTVMQLVAPFAPDGKALAVSSASTRARSSIPVGAWRWKTRN